MKVAAAVLGASLLFFLGVLTGAGRREALPPPAAIRLGVGNPASPADPSSPQTPGSTPRATTPKPPAAGSNPSTATTAATTRPDGTVPPASDVTTTSTRGSGDDVPGTSTSTTADSGQVEHVDNQVDCRPAGKPGKGKREPCPSTTASTAEAPGGGGNR